VGLCSEVPLLAGMAGDDTRAAFAAYDHSVSRVIQEHLLGRPGALIGAGGVPGQNHFFTRKLA
jgi:hypothetical protein